MNPSTVKNCEFMLGVSRVHCEPKSTSLFSLRSVRLFSVIVFAFALSSCNSKHQSFASPDGKNTAWIFTRDGGATTDYSQQVSIGSSKPGGIGNIYVQGHNEAVTVRWLSNTDLEITTDPNAKPIKRETSFGKVTIHYKTR